MLACGDDIDARQLHDGPGHLRSERADSIVNVSAAAREGVEAAVRAAMARADREAYRQRPERPDPFWSDVEAWTEE